MEQRDDRPNLSSYDTPTRKHQQSPRYLTSRKACAECGLESVHHITCSQRNKSEIMMQWEREITARPKQQKLDEQATLERQISEDGGNTASEMVDRNKIPRFEIRGRASSERLQGIEVNGSNGSPARTTSPNTPITPDNVRMKDVDVDDQAYGQISLHRDPDMERRYYNLPSTQTSDSSFRFSDLRTSDTPATHNPDEIDIDDDFDAEAFKMMAPEPEFVVPRFPRHIELLRDRYTSFSEVVNPTRIRPTALDLWDASARHITPF